MKSWRRVLVVAVAVLAVVGTGVGVYALSPPRQQRDVAMPPVDATPEQVVRAYLDSLDAHDCRTAKALSTDEEKKVTESWCKNVASLENVHVGSHKKESPADDGQPASTDVAGVAVEFDLRWRLFHHDGSMEEGGTTWGYELVRTTPRSPWRIFDQGTG